MIARKLIFLAGALLIAGGLLAGCSTSDEAAKDQSSEEEIETEETGEQESKADEKSEPEKKDSSEKDDHVIDVSAFEMGYDPKEITLTKGEEYELVLNNDGEMFHDLTQKKLDIKITYMSEMADHPESLSFLDKMLGVKKSYASGDHDGGHEGETKNIHMNAKSGQTVRVKFIPQEKGEFEFFCSIPGHKETGMVGKFIVE
ncbi:plastocyanin/azurin family copper-binding protein [Halobacillus seohaensis]|uniref:Plastocyanin/azurin family copper-binding protein n=1 Tax=Halobacillus seohaensis TaxID=447421 RepID=A0ABW2EIA1_9BACI